MEYMLFSYELWTMNSGFNSIKVSHIMKVVIYVHIVLYGVMYGLLVCINKRDLQHKAPPGYTYGVVIFVGCI